MKPFIKWVGGKKQLLPALQERLPESFSAYYEPFLGGGALFFHLAASQQLPETVVLSDINDELITTWRVLQRDPEPLIALLETYPYDESFFYAMRSKDPASLNNVERAARFIYLNRTCFNGLYRVNRKGGFNVPFGRHTNPTICDTATLTKAHGALQGVTIRGESFEDACRDAPPGALVYFDPPYVPASATANFTKYSDRGFDLTHQEQLAALFESLSRRGVHVLLSNASVPWVLERYAGFHITTVDARRSVNSNASRRGAVQEVLISNLPG